MSVAPMLAFNDPGQIAPVADVTSSAKQAFAMAPTDEARTR